MADDQTSMAAIGYRMKVTREALGYTQGHICLISGITPQTWSNAEVGRQRLGLSSALKLSRVTGVALDWIYQGDRALLPRKIAEYLAKLEAEGEPPNRKSRKRA